MSTTDGPLFDIYVRPSLVLLFTTCRNAADLVEGDFNQRYCSKNRSNEKTRRWCVCFVCLCAVSDVIDSPPRTIKNRILVNVIRSQVSCSILLSYTHATYKTIVTMKVIAALIVTASSVAAFSPASFGTRCTSFFLYNWITVGWWKGGVTMRDSCLICRRFDEPIHVEWTWIIFLTLPSILFLLSDSFYCHSGYGIRFGLR